MFFFCVFFVLIVDVMCMFFCFFVGRLSGEHLCHDLFLFCHRNTPNTYLLIDLFKLAGMMLILTTSQCLILMEKASF